MTRPTRETSSTPDFNRIMTRVEDANAALTERFEAAVERFTTHLESVEREGRLGRQEIRKTQSEVSELASQVNATREEMQRFKGAQTSAAASGAAEGAAKGASEGLAPAIRDAARVSPKNTVKEIFATNTGKLISFSAVVIAIQQGITGIPVIVRWVGHAAVGAWTFFSKDVK